MQQHFSTEDILKMERDYRRNFINAISGFKSVNLIGTLSYRKIANVAIFNSVTHIGANPPLLGFMIRPLTVPRQTYHNIIAQGCFTINTVTTAYLDQAHQTSAKYDEYSSEFEATQLTPFYTDQLVAPYVEESPIKIGLKLEETHEIKANGCIFVVGQIMEIMIQENMLNEHGYIFPESENVVSVLGVDRYYAPAFIKQKGYARPKNDH